MKNDVDIDGLVGLYDGFEVLDVGAVFGGGIADESLIGTCNDADANFFV